MLFFTLYITLSGLTIIVALCSVCSAKVTNAASNADDIPPTAARPRERRECTAGKKLAESSQTPQQILRGPR